MVKRNPPPAPIKAPTMENPGDGSASGHGHDQLICFSEALARIRSLEGQLIVAHTQRGRTTERIQQVLDYVLSAIDREDVQYLHDLQQLTDVCGSQVHGEATERYQTAARLHHVLSHLRLQLVELIEATAQPPGGASPSPGGASPRACSPEP